MAYPASMWIPFSTLVIITTIGGEYAGLNSTGIIGDVKVCGRVKI
jgi:hypothetical protein